jgi:hypothetical protein
MNASKFNFMITLPLTARLVSGVLEQFAERSTTTGY